MKLKAKTLGVILVAILFGGIVITAGLGYWKTKSTKQPVRFQGGTASGEFNPADIRGSYTFGDVSELFEIPLTDLTFAFGLTTEPNAASLRLGSLESQYGNIGEGIEIGTGSVRLFVAWYKDLPYQPSGDEYLLMPAVIILEANASLTADQIAYLDSHVITLGSGQVGNVGIGIGDADSGTVGNEAGNDGTLSTKEADNGEVSTEEAAAQTAENGDSPAETDVPHDSSTDQIVRGKTTFRDLLNWGLTVEQIESVIGMDMPSPLQNVRDFTTANGLGFNNIKQELQALIDEN